MGITRKTFLVSLAGGGALLVVGGCGGGGDSGAANNDNGGGGGGGAAAANCGATITANHGHSVTVAQADLDAAADHTYSILGSSDHAHSITLSAADFTALKAGQPVTVTSSVTFDHTHSVTISCV